MTAKKCTKKCDVVVLLIQQIAFLTFSLSSPSWHNFYGGRGCGVLGRVRHRSPSSCPNSDFKVSRLFAFAVSKTQEDVIIGKADVSNTFLNNDRFYD